ncbi:hypothetical protein DSO57_1019257 [Entomophthora muscae]|uniref:Uncharacterized protein n=2 Tax=Entomophthora muscae TaxID=34485 RepID=A0ACC2UPY9_9FUNG|nr:hypothetical protein DSO57_1021473 [Entomophthora muscae]KAJ9088821.1 hypothetical protein DSO57_1019257 [Entomophthora muscae]
MNRISIVRIASAVLVAISTLSFGAVSSPLLTHSLPTRPTIRQYLGSRATWVGRKLRRPSWAAPKIRRKKKTAA